MWLVLCHYDGQSREEVSLYSRLSLQEPNQDFTQIVTFECGDPTLSTENGKSCQAWVLDWGLANPTNVEGLVRWPCTRRHVCVGYWGKKRKIVLDCGRRVPTSPRVAAQWSEVYASLIVDSLLLYLGMFIGKYLAYSMVSVLFYDIIYL